MDNAAVVKGEFVTFKHVKTRKTFTIEIEFPEEQGRIVLDTLGMPIGGESKPVAVALLAKSIVTKLETNCDKTKGEKLRIRAIMLCKDSQFQDFAAYNTIFSVKAGLEAEEVAKKYILRICRIDSRGELASRVAAQIEFEDMLEKYKDWQAENNYSENLNRI